MQHRQVKAATSLLKGVLSIDSKVIKYILNSAKICIPTRDRGRQALSLFSLQQQCPASPPNSKPHLKTVKGPSSLFAICFVSNDAMESALVSRSIRRDGWSRLSHSHGSRRILFQVFPAIHGGIGPSLPDYDNHLQMPTAVYKRQKRCKFFGPIFVFHILISNIPYAYFQRFLYFYPKTSTHAPSGFANLYRISAYKVATDISSIPDHCVLTNNPKLFQSLSILYYFQFFQRIFGVDPSMRVYHKYPSIVRVKLVTPDRNIQFSRKHLTYNA
ncbi:hypothetical protein VTP01DRAFT_44 [Rhizomucor pusillus]|uniref:uncharacterized protein n=1 Tax=Rhizomucor pusillus TaxID=4840 RepID=UPI0037436CE8